MTAAFHEDEIETQPVILPYTYRVLTGGRVSIIHPAGVQLTYSQSQIEHKLSGEAAPMREMCVHERLMFESALAYLKEHDGNPTY